MIPRYYKNLDQYSYFKSEKTWLVALITPYGNISETWPQDQEPEIQDLLPTEIVDLIEKRLDTHLLCTGRDETKKKIADIRAHGVAIDRAWLKNKIKDAEHLVQKYRLRLDQFDAMQEEIS